MKEHQLQSECNKYLRDNDIPFIHLEKGKYHKSRHHRKGIPDLIIFKKKVLILMELKSEKGILKTEQKEFLERWAK